MVLYAHAGDIERMGKPATTGDLVRHHFFGPEFFRSIVPHHNWMQENVPESKGVFRSNSPSVLQEAILGGIVIVFLFELEALGHSELRQIFPPREEWNVVNWLVTHGDLNRTAKVQAFLKILKNTGAAMPG